MVSPFGKLTGTESSFHYRASEKNFTVAEGGKYLKVDTSVFPISKTLSAMIVEVKPGAMREMHWHPNVNFFPPIPLFVPRNLLISQPSYQGQEWLYFIEGNARGTVWLGNGHARTFDFTTGDTAVFPDNAGTLPLTPV